VANGEIVTGRQVAAARGRLDLSSFQASLTAT
jgi:hypothetical protein